ncbi:MAG TPA: hypothetical protein VFX85_02870 [Solirubrobacterales bacterium]|nr:hypothetical protein [Solirubrobacterales bacterium]
MKAHGIDRKLRDADRFSDREMERLELGPATAALAAAILAEPAEPATAAAADASPPPWPAAGDHRRGLLGAAGLAAAAVIAAVVLLLGGGSSHSPSPAYGAALVRFAESTPLLLLEGPGWRVQDVFQIKGREGPEGSMEFVTGKPVPDETVWVSGTPTRPRQKGMLPPAVRQRLVKLSWSPRSLASEIATIRAMAHPHGRRVIKLPVLDTTATVDTRAEFYVNQGGPGNRQMVALWSEGGYTLRIDAAVPDLSSFEERLGWLTKVDAQTWLDAMPEQVVKAADHEAAVREILKGIPVPATFKPSRVPDEGLTTNRYQVGAAVTGTVSCLWFRQWDRARRSGDQAAVAEAVRAMTSSKGWPVLHEMAEEGAYPETIWQLAEDMPKGYWDWRGHKRRLLSRAEGLGCARLGIPLLPWKQKRQDEREAGGPR